MHALAGSVAAMRRVLRTLGAWQTRLLRATGLPFQLRGASVHDMTLGAMVHPFRNA